MFDFPKNKKGKFCAVLTLFCLKYKRFSICFKVRWTGLCAAVENLLHLSKKVHPDLVVNYQMDFDFAEEVKDYSFCYS